MTSPADAYITALRANHNRLEVLVAQLADPELEGPSADTEWSIADVLSHLGSGAVIALGGLRAAQDPAVTAEPNSDVWDRWNVMTPRDQLTGFLAANEALVSSYEALDEASRTDLRFQLGFLPEPADLVLVLRFRLQEAALHCWDIASTFDPGATVPATEAALLLDHVELMLAWIGHADAIAGDATLTVRTTEPEREFGLSITERVALTDPAANPAGTLTLPAEAWLRLASGRLKADRTPQAVHLDAANLTLDDLRAIFPGY